MESGSDWGARRTNRGRCFPERTIMIRHEREGRPLSVQFPCVHLYPLLCYRSSLGTSICDPLLRRPFGRLGALIQARAEGLPLRRALRHALRLAVRDRLAVGEWVRVERREMTRRPPAYRSCLRRPLLRSLCASNMFTLRTLHTSADSEQKRRTFHCFRASATACCTFASFDCAALRQGGRV